MATTTVPPKSNSKQTTNNQTANSDKNDRPMTEEELKKKDTPINVNDVLQLKKPTKGNHQKESMRIYVCLSFVDYLTETDENVYKIDFIHFRIRDMKTNKTLFEVQREPGMCIE